MNFKRLMAASLIGAATVASPAAFAGITGNVGVFSEYMFRGIVQEKGAEVFGGVDYAHDSGAYVGTWISNANIGGAGSGSGGGSEADFYAGFAGKATDTISYDVGGIYYLYAEDDEVKGDAKFDYYEFYAGISVPYVSAKYYYSPDFASVEDTGPDVDGEAHYITGTLTLPISDSVALAFQAGHSSGDGIKAYYGQTYTDYSVTLSKAVKEGLTFTVSLIGTDLDRDASDGGTPADPTDDVTKYEDKPKFIVGAKQVFDF